MNHSVTPPALAPIAVLNNLLETIHVEAHQGREALRPVTAMILHSCNDVAATFFAVNEEEDVDVVANTSWCRKVVIGTQAVTGILHASFHNVTSLNVYACDASSAELSLMVKSARALQFLDLDWCEGLNASVFQTVMQHSDTLTALSVSSTDFELPWLAGLSQLRALDLDRCAAVTDVGLQQHVSCLRNLRQLSLDGCGVSWEAFAGLS